MCIICRQEYDNTTTTINCSGCDKVKEIPNLPLLDTLFCDNCDNLEIIPSLSNLSFLSCSNCKNLKQIPNLPYLKILNCHDCSSLQEILPYHSIVEIDCRRCPSLFKIEESKTLKDLYCERCPSLKTLPSFQKLTRLDCSYCASLEEIGRIGTIYRKHAIVLFEYIELLDCSYCPKLKMLQFSLYENYSPTHVGKLICTNCRSLTRIELDLIQGVKFLIIPGCVWLQPMKSRMESLKQIQKFWRRGLKRLKEKKKKEIGKYLSSDLVGLECFERI